MQGMYMYGSVGESVCLVFWIFNCFIIIRAIIAIIITYICCMQIIIIE